MGLGFNFSRPELNREQSWTIYEPGKTACFTLRTYIHTYIHTYMYIPPHIKVYIHTYIYIHTCKLVPHSPAYVKLCVSMYHTIVLTKIVE